MMKSILPAQGIAVPLYVGSRDADESSEQPVISQVEREAVQEQIIARTADVDSLPPSSSKVSMPITQLSSLVEAEFLDELRSQEEFYAKRPNGFVGLVRFHLTELGHNESSAREMLDLLQKEDKVEVYYVDNPYDNSATTAALRTRS